MSESTLVPHNCEACGYWTATEISRTRAGWLLQCTHCGGKLHERGGARAFRMFLTAIARFQQKASVHYPELARLTVRGAYAKLSAATARKSPPPSGTD